jgi:molecular chaperone HscA
MAQPYQLVIDLGTCHTVAVVRREGQAPRALLFDGSPLLPSGVYRDPSGAYSVGRDAERLSQVDPTRFEPYPKRTIDDGVVLLGDAPTPVVDMLAALLRRVLAETADGSPRQVTLTCPADWGQQRRDILRAAARAAGLPEVRLVDEPIAAATYCTEVLGTPIPLGGCLLVFDFGGGTLDVTVVRRDADHRRPADPAQAPAQDGLRVLAVGGLDDLGGVDIDAALVGHLGQLVALRQPQAWQRIAGPETTGDQRARRAFWMEVRAAKEMLSRSASAPVQVPGTDDSLHLTREELDRVAGPLVDRAVDETRRVLGRAGVAPGTLAGILLVGGSSRMPLVASRLHTRFQVAPTVPEQPELPVAYGGLLVGWPTRSGPASPAAGPSGPVSAAPYQSAPVTGTGTPFGVPVAYPSGGPVPAPPAAWSPESGLPPPRPPAWGAAQPQAPQQNPLSWPGAAVPAPGWTPPPASAPAPRRGFPVRALVAVCVALALVGGVIWGGYQLFGAAKRGISGALSGDAANGGTGGGAAAGSGGGLQQSGTAIDLSGDGARAVAAGNSLVFYSVSGNGKTVVHAVDPASGKDKWTQTVTLDPSEASMHTVGDLLVLDGKGSATDGGKDMRVVLQSADGKQVQKLDWSKKRDIAYVGTDAIVATTWQPYQTLRVNLKTGATAWKSAPLASINAWHPVSPELTWTATANVPAPAKGFTESFGVNPDRFVQLDYNESTAQVVNGNGKTVASGRVPIDDDVNNVLWTAYDGLVVGALNDTASPGRATLGAYRLDNLKQAWTVPLGAGDALDYVHPCGEHVVCATYDKKTDDTKAIVAVDTTTGKRLTWASPPPYGDFSDDPYWSVHANLMLYGGGDFPPDFDCRDTGIAVLKPDTGASVRSIVDSTRGCSGSVVAAAGRYLAMRSLKIGLGGSSSWQLSIVDITTGKQTDGLDTGTSKDLPVGVAVSGTTLAVIGGDRKLHIAVAPNLA